jgi:hypothetical protein
MNYKPGDIDRFKLEVTRQHVAYLKYIRTRGYTIDEEKLAQLEAEIEAEDARLAQNQKPVDDE